MPWNPSAPTSAVYSMNVPNVFRDGSAWYARRAVRLADAEPAVQVHAGASGWTGRGGGRTGRAALAPAASRRRPRPRRAPRMRRVLGVRPVAGERRVGELRRRDERGAICCGVTCGSRSTRCAASVAPPESMSCGCHVAGGGRYVRVPLPAGTEDRSYASPARSSRSLEVTTMPHRSTRPRSSRLRHPERLVSTEWLQEQLDAGAGPPTSWSSSPTRTSCSTRRATYPGAVKIDWHTDLNDPSSATTSTARPSPGSSAARASARDTTVVIYGDKNNWWAAYALWGSRCSATRSPAALDGGGPKWIAEDRAVTTDRTEVTRSSKPVVERATSRSAIQGGRAQAPRQATHRRAQRPQYSGERTTAPDYPVEGALRAGHVRPREHPGPPRPLPTARSRAGRNWTPSTATVRHRGCDEVIAYCASASARATPGSSAAPARLRNVRTTTVVDRVGQRRARPDRHGHRAGYRSHPMSTELPRPSPRSRRLPRTLAAGPPPAAPRVLRRAARAARAAAGARGRARACRGVPVPRLLHRHGGCGGRCAGRGPDARDGATRGTDHPRLRVDPGAGAVRAVRTRGPGGPGGLPLTLGLTEAVSPLRSGAWSACSVGCSGRCRRPLRTDGGLLTDGRRGAGRHAPLPFVICRTRYFPSWSSALLPCQDRGVIGGRHHGEGPRQRSDWVLVR